MCNHILCLYSRSDVVLHFLQLETLTRCRCISRCVCPERVVERCPRDITLIPHYSSDYYLYWQSGSKKTASQTNHTSNTKVYFLWDGSKSVQLLESYSSPAPRIGYCAQGSLMHLYHIFQIWTSCLFLQNSGYLMM